MRYIVIIPPVVEVVVFECTNILGIPVPVTAHPARFLVSPPVLVVTVIAVPVLPCHPSIVPGVVEDPVVVGVQVVDAAFVVYETAVGIGPEAVSNVGDNVGLLAGLYAVPVLEKVTFNGLFAVVNHPLSIPDPVGPFPPINMDVGVRYIKKLVAPDMLYPIQFSTRPPFVSEGVAFVLK
jgi:hypothetical protein